MRTEYGLQHEANRRAAAANATIRRVGIFPLVINATIIHRLSEPMTVNGRLLGVGTPMHLGVQDLTLHPEAEEHTQWVCSSPHCEGKRWPTKRELLNGHAPDRELQLLEQVHCYHGVARIPAVNALPAKCDKDGNLIANAVEARPAKVMLLSDEE